MIYPMLALAVLTTAAATPANDALKSTFDELHGQATAAEYEIFDAAVKSSPLLTAQMNDLASAGLLKKISVESTPATPLPGVHFGASVHGSEWVFTTAFLQEKTKRVFDVVRPDDILPSHVVFALGHLAYHGQHAAEITRQENEWRANAAIHMKTVWPGTRYDATADIKVMEELHMHDEAGAYIQGWNDVLDAAVKQNGNAPLQLRQAATLLMNLRYQAPFFKAMQATPNKLEFSADGRIEPNQTNVEALASVLGTSQLIEVK
jgi:hypothetical protein